MKFDTYESVSGVVRSLVQADLPRATNRSLINELFNGNQPYSETEAEENNINTNVNFLDATRIGHDARNTFNNAFLKPGNYFKISLDSGPLFKKDTYARTITKHINKKLKNSTAYTEVLRSEFAQTVLHGVGPTSWDKKKSWCPKSIGIEEFLVPSRTRSSFENLEYFSIYRQYTPSQLYAMTHSKKVDPGWNMKVVDEILKKYREDIFTGMSNTSNNFFNSPEKLAEAMKSDGGLYEMESVPSINMREFLYKAEDSEENEWYRKIILDDQEGQESTREFIYDPKKRVFANDHKEIIHVMFGDGANVAPFKYHSVRGLGFLLYAVCHLQNRMLCKFNDSVFEQMLWYFRVSNPEDRERLNKLDLHHLGIIPDGLNFVTGSERYTPNFNLINEAFSMNRQSMSENSAQFKQDINDGTSKEMTAKEVMARMNSANALVGSMLNLAYTLQIPQYKEICRRFCLKDSDDPDVKDFRKQCLKDGVPEEFLDVDKWEIEPERVLGAGNRTLETAEADRLMAVRTLLDPEAQREVLHMYVEANTQDARLSERLVPAGKKQVSDSIHDAQLAAATLMLGMPLAIKSGINRTEYIEALLNSMGAVLQRIEKTGNTTDMKEVMGLDNMGNHIDQNIQLLAQDEQEAQRVKQYGDVLGRMMNQVKALGQRANEKMQSEGQNGLTPEAQAKIVSAQMLAQTQGKIKEASANQKMAHKEQSFLSDQARKDVALNADLNRQGSEHRVTLKADLEQKDLMTAAELHAQNLKQQNETRTQE